MKRLFCLTILCCTLGGAAAADLKAVFGAEKPPFAFANEKGVTTGIEIDTVGEALKRMGHRLVPRAVANNRLLEELKNGHADIAVTVKGKDGNGIYFSDDFVTFVNFAISKKSRGAVVNSIADLDKYSFIIWQGGWRDLGPQFEARYHPDAAGKFPANYFEGFTQLGQSTAFWKGTTDLIIVDKTIFQWFRRQLGKTMDTREEVVYHDIFERQTGYPVAFRDRALRDQFNLELKKMRNDGTLQEILNRYK